MNGRLELRIITQPYSEVYWGYFRRLVFGSSLTKHSIHCFITDPVWNLDGYPMKTSDDLEFLGYT